MPDLKKLRSILGYTQKDMANMLSIKQNTYSSIETGRISLTDRNKRILAEQLHLNREWLNDTKDSTPFLNTQPDIEPKHPRQYLDPERLAVQLSVAPDSEHGTNETRPRIPITAAAGSLSGEALGVTLLQCEQLPIIHQIPSYDFTMFIKGDSMSPRFESGDEIACRKIDQSRFVQWGKVHVLDSTQGVIIKRVYEDGDKIRCVSYNPAYADFSIPKEDVYSMGLVVGSISITEI